jgi:hypothetical protein
MRCVGFVSAGLRGRFWQTVSPASFIAESGLSEQAEA